LGHGSSWLLAQEVAKPDAASQGVQATQPEFAAGTQLVQLDAVVLDRDGEPVRGLKAEDFEVEEDGHPQSIVSFQTIEFQAPMPRNEPPGVSAPQPFVPEQGRYVVLFFDDHHLGPQTTERLRAGLGPFVTARLGERDHITIVAPKSGISWAVRSGDDQYLTRVIDRLDGMFRRYPFSSEWIRPISEWGAMRFVEFGPKAAGAEGPPEKSFRLEGRNLHEAMGPRPEEVYAQARTRLNLTLRDLQIVLERLSGVRGRKSVILFTEGFLYPPAGGGSFASVVEQARRANVVIEFVYTSGLEVHQSPSSTFQRGAEGAAFLAESTGGRSTASNDITSTLNTVLKESSAYYLLGYRPPRGRSGERRVRVRVRQDGLTVRARSRYYIGAPLRDTHPKAPAMRALQPLADTDALGLRVQAFPAPDVTGVSLAVEITPLARPRARELKLYAEALPLSGGAPFHDAATISLPATSKPVALRRVWELSQDVWQARIALVDTETHETSSLVHTFEVPNR
jgi:VWFA-related protein